MLIPARERHSHKQFRPSKKMDNLEYHEAANIFPLMEGDSFQQFKLDISRNGQLEKIVLFGGKILDGRNRYRACIELGIAPQFEDWRGDDPVAFVISRNLHRRHLTPSQASMCAARAREWYDREAKERQKEHGNTAPGRTKTLPVNLPEVKKGETDARNQVGKAFGVSGKTVDYATKVLNDAIPEVVKAVDDGRMAVSTAAILASEPEEVQREEATKPKRNRKYRTTRVQAQQPERPEEEGNEEEVADNEIKAIGIGVVRAHEAINCLKRIPKNDALRKRGFQIVTDWIRHTLKGEK